MLFLTLLSTLLLVGAQASVSGIIDVADKDRVRILSALTTGFVKLQPDDLDSLYYAAKGYAEFKEGVVQVFKMDGCAHLQKYFKKDGSPESVFHALSGWALLECKGKLHDDAAVISALKANLEKPSSSADVRYAMEALQFLKQAIPNPAKISQVLQQRVKEDDSLLSLGNALHAASLLGSHGKFVLDRVEDVVVQADEVDGRMLQWEGGLSTTALLLTGLFKLPGAKPLTQDQADKFAAYLLTRKSVQTAKGALALYDAAVAISSSNVSPVSITLAKSAQVTVEKPDLIVRVSDILGRPLKPTPSPIVAQSATRVNDDVVVLSKQPLAAGVKPTEFILPLRLEPGQYRIALSAGSQSQTITARVLGPISLQSIEIGVGDSDGSSAPKMTKLQHPNKLTTSLQADSNQNLILKFNLPRNVHQAFLRLHSEKKEIIFIAEKDTSQTYKINVYLAGELSSSGVYNMELILGDSIMSNPMRWDLGTVEAKLATSVTPKPPTHKAKPEIKHLFRTPEKRPPQAVSMLFTGAAAAPLLILLVLWMKIGIPFNYFNIFSIPFHAGYAGILGLYTYFWVCGNMFTTCAWLLYIGGFTFISGNRMLRGLASHKK